MTDPEIRVRREELQRQFTELHADAYDKDRTRSAWT